MRSLFVLFSLLAALALTGVAVLGPDAALAQETSDSDTVGCEAFTIDGEPRSCTLLEGMLYCQVNAGDSWYQCTDDASFLRKIGCWVEWSINMTGCIPASFFVLIS